ncbi:MAG: type II secretion system F family protein [Fimbriimonadaceae bacterium]
MHVFKYKGYDSTGSVVQGEISGPSIDDVERRVASQDVTIISIVPAGFGHKSSQSAAGEVSGTPGKLGRTVSSADLAVVLRDLSVMAETGVPFVEALDALIASAKSATIGNGLKQLRAQIVGGKGLSAGMRTAPNLFPPMVCDMVKVAEEGGRLDKALASAAVYVERSADLKKKVLNAMIYPIVLTIIAAITLVVLVVFVLPKFSSIFSKMGASLPWTTKMMLFSGNAIRENPIQTMLILAVGATALFFLLKTRVAKNVVGSVVLRLPVIGELVKRLSFSRSFQSIATLISSNVSLLAAIEHGAKVAGNPVIQRAFMSARDDVEKGVSLSDALAETKVFPPMLVQMVSVGERTGRLPSLMKSTAGHMEEDADSRLKALISIVEPMMIVVMGTIVGFITLSIIIPIYSFVEKVK